jgi:TonB family protein
MGYKIKEKCFPSGGNKYLLLKKVFWKPCISLFIYPFHYISKKNIVLIMQSVLQVLFLLILTIYSCSPKGSSPIKEKDTGFLFAEYLILKDGSYNLDSLDRNPISLLGSEGFLKRLYSTMNYPADARNNGISGTVLLQLSIDKQGHLVDLVLKESLSEECDKEAMQAVLHAAKARFQPAIKNGVPVFVKFDFPVRYRLE